VEISSMPTVSPETVLRNGWGDSGFKVSRAQNFKAQKRRSNDEDETSGSLPFFGRAPGKGYLRMPSLPITAL
jgi:hypothetical protein